jgi:hypothetical protein
MHGKHPVIAATFQRHMSDQNAPPKVPFTRRAGHYLTNALIVGLIRFALLIPYRARLGFVGWVIQHLIAPLAGYRTRALENPCDDLAGYDGKTQKRDCGGVFKQCRAQFHRKLLRQGFPCPDGAKHAARAGHGSP